MSTIVTLLNLPHIVDTIAVSLPFLDLLNCALVSHAWCDALVWVIWRHVVTFRQRDSIVGHHFETSTTRQILSKHATQIQAVTCGDQDILPALAESGCTALRHINYVLLDKRQPNSVESLLEPFMRLSLSDTSIATNSGILGLQRLYQLISFNPTAHSVSIEKLSLHDKKEVKELIAFIEVLDL
ncbi:hypothetical protein BG005_002606 [Podila minutissima]|nr:hypothetical protein BG005_002606 [Podila minutissima]